MEGASVQPSGASHPLSMVSIPGGGPFQRPRLAEMINDCQNRCRGYVAAFSMTMRQSRFPARNRIGHLHCLNCHD